MMGKIYSFLLAALIFFMLSQIRACSALSHWQQLANGSTLLVSAEDSKQFYAIGYQRGTFSASKYNSDGKPLANVGIEIENFTHVATARITEDG